VSWEEAGSEREKKIRKRYIMGIELRDVTIIGAIQ